MSIILWKKDYKEDNLHHLNYNLIKRISSLNEQEKQDSRLWQWRILAGGTSGGGGLGPEGGSVQVTAEEIEA